MKRRILSLILSLTLVTQLILPVAAEIDAEETDATESMQAQELQEEESRPETIVEVPETTAPVTEETEPVEQDGSPETVIVPEACPPDSVKILQVPSVLSAGETCQLAVTVLPENAEYTLNWESSNSTVVTVSEDGMLTAVSGGTAKITVSIAEAETVFDTVEVTVAQPVDPLASLRAMLAEYAHIADVPDGQPLEDEGFFLCEVSAGTADTVTLQPGVHTPDGISVQYAWLKLNAEQTAFEPMAETATSVMVAVDEVEQYACLVSYQDTGAVVLFQISEDQLSTMEVETQSAVVISRADWVSAMVDTLGLSIAKSQYPDNYYSDITKDSSCYDDVMVATAYGLISVTEGTPFEPDASATRNFAAETAVSLVGFQSKGSVSFADEAQCANPTAAKVAVERGWISLSGGNFCPDQEITAAEKDAILADCLSARESTKVDSYYDSKFNFKENVFVFDPSVVAELVDDSTVKIYEPDAAIQTGALIAVYTWEIPTVFKVAAVTKQEDCLLVTGQIQKLEDNVDSMDAEGSVTVDLLDVQPAEGVTATYIFTDQTQTQSLSYARTMVARGQKRIRDVVLNKTINLGTNINIQITGLLSDLVVDYRLNATPGNADVLVALSGKESVTVNGDVSVNWSDTLASLPIEGIGSLEITSSLKVEAGITSTTSGRFRVGVSYTSNDGLQAIREYVPESFTLDAETKGTMRVRAQLGLADWFPMISGNVYAEAGYTVEALRNTVSGRTPETCIELSSWTFVTIGYYASIYDPLDGIDETYKGSYPIYDKTNSPERVVFHYEDGILVSECTVPGNDFSRYKTPSDSRFGSGSWNLGGNTGRRSNGETFKIFTYTLDKDENATITGYNGNASALSIPATIDGHPVVAIGQSAFSGRTGLQAVYIADSVMEIETEAFMNCKSLKTVKLSKALSYMGYGAFENCVSLTSIEIPKSLKKASTHGPFRGCTNLSLITFENGTTEVAEGLFESCPGLTSIVIPDTVTVIEGNAFSNSALKEVVIGSNVTSIENGAFYRTGITEVEIPDSVTEIETEAFLNCKSLKTVKLSKALSYMGYGAFENCVSLTSIEIPKSLKKASTHGPFRGCTNLSLITFENGTTEVAEGLFESCPGLTSIVIPDTVTVIEGNAFSNSALKEVVIGSNVTSIENGAFYRTGITEVEIPDSVTEIETEAFLNCKSLKTVKLSKALSYMGYGAFENCVSLTSIEIPKSLKKASTHGPFRGCTNLSSITFENGTTEVAEGLFESCPGLTSIVIPDTVTVIEGNAFSNSALKEVVIGSNVTSIENGAFYGTGITEVEIPDSVTEIETEAFLNCKSLKTVKLSKALSYMGYGAFENCVSLTSIEIPKSLKKASTHGPFRGCTNLSSITFENGTTEVAEGLFESCPGLTSIVIPDTVTVIEGYAFANSALKEVVIGSNVTSIEYNAFYGTRITEVEIPDSVTEIETEAFLNCTSLESVTLSASLTSLGTYVFKNCEKLQSISLPDRLTTVPSETFRGCSALETVTLGNSVTKIDTSAFRSCIALREITIPNTVTTIGDSAFQNCDSLTKIVVPDSVTSFGTYVFYDCDSLTDVTLSGNMTSIPQYTFGDCDVLEEIVVPRRVTSIDGYAFTNAVKFHAITIPRSVTSIASTAFSYPQKLTIYGVAGTYAETFANEKNITFVDKQVNAESVSLNTSEISLAKGASQTLVLSVSPVDCTDAVSWKSSNTSVVTISDTGALKAVGLGTATIKVVVGSKSASCKVTVYQPVTSISLNRSSLSMGALDTFQLTATVSPSTAVNKDVTWSSSAPEIASVTDNGLVTALGKGKATITVKAADGSGVSRSCSVTVTNSAHIAETVSELESSHPYADNCTDVWVYTIQNAKQLKVTFDSQTEMEDGFDYLLIQDGSGTLVQKSTGTELAGQSVSVPGDTLRIQMQSDDSGNAWGFKVTDVQSVKPDCKHVSDAGTVTKEPACETAGTKTFTCTKCGETLREETIPPLGHNEKVTKAGTAATCTQSGLTEEKTCTRCGKITQAQTVIPALEHNWGETVYQWTEDHSGCTAHRTCKRDNTHTESAEAQVSTTTQEATCSEPGKQEFIAVFDEVWAEKTVFTQTLELLPHVPVVDEAVEPTCTEPGRTSGTHCERCNEVLNAPVVIPALGHQWSKGVVTGTDPQTGYPIVTFVCQVCQAEKQETGTVVQVDGPTQLVIGESGSFTAEILPASSQNTVYEWSLSQEDQAFATIKVDKKNSARITLVAGKYLTEIHTVTLRVHSTDATVDGTYAVQLVPKTVWIDIFSGEEVVTGKQLPVDLNDQGALDITFRAQIYPEDARANLTWSCSDSKGRFCTMTDNQDGTVSVHLLKDASAATVTLTAKDPLSKKTAAVKLSTIRVSTGISIQSPAEGISVYGGTTISLSAVLEGSPKNKAVSWSLPDAYCTYATISGSTLKLLDVSEPTRIQLNASAADGGAEAETWLTILPRVSRLRMTWNGVSASGSYTVYLDHTDDITLKAFPFPSASDDDVLWEGLNSEIADFTVDGATLVIHALNKVGKLNITARSKMDRKVSASVTLVVAKHADSIQIFDSKGGTISDANSVTVAGGKTYSFKDSVTTSKDKAITDKTVNWSIDKPEYASIQNGKLRVNPFAGEPVDLIVTACLNADSSITSSVTIRLIPNLASQIRVYWDGTDVAGKTIPASIGVRQLHLQAEAIGCDDEITWSSSNHSVATVDSEGVVSLLKPGNVTITAAQEKKQKATIKLNVVNPITNIQINGQNFVAAGKTLKLDTSINGADVSLPPTQEKLTWLLNPGDEAFASISNGTLKAANISARCTVTVYACVEGRDVCSLPFHVTIAPAATNVLIRSESGSTIDIRDTEQVQLNAQLAPTQANQDVVWSCSGKGVTIDADGILTISPSAKPGSVVVTATAADGSKCKASIRLTLVRKMRSEDLTLPEELSIKGGKIYKIPVTLSNGSESSLVWTVDNTAWATISKGKLSTKKVTGVKYITVTAIAGDGSGVSKTCRIAITP